MENRIESFSITLDAIVFQNVKDGKSFWAYLTKYPNVIAFGPSHDEAKQNLLQALDEILDQKLVLHGRIEAYGQMYRLGLGLRDL